MTYILVFSIEILLIVEAGRRLNLASAAMMTFGYILVAQTFFLYSSMNFSASTFKAGSSGTFYYTPKFGILVYGAIYLAIYTATFGTKQSKSFDFSSLKKMKLKKVSLYLYILTFFVTAIRLSTIDLNILWHNNTYLLIKSSDALTLQGVIPSLAKSTLEIFAILVAGLAAANYLKRNMGAAVIGTILIIPSLLISMASASRASGMILIAIAISFLLFGTSWRHRAIVILCVVICGVLFVTALHGRSTGVFGITAIPTHFKISDTPRDIPIIEIFIGSLVQGIFVTTDSIRLEAKFAEIYKLLSFSPFPSALDGFSEILPTYEIRLHKYVPMSAIGEVYHFGPVYIAIYSITTFLLYRGNAKLDATKTPVKFLTTSVFITLFFIVAQTYPMRNTYRQLLIALLLLHYETLWRHVRPLLVKTTRKL
ncbi:hypothetical protein [Methylophaga sp.]|uniref:hypothetical protein n=1 Tax=Methylophaga sp. TaxID=2024840 RepID=UPI003A8FB2E0